LNTCEIEPGGYAAEVGLGIKILENGDEREGGGRPIEDEQALTRVQVRLCILGAVAILRRR
jgi:hypothetical protein